MYTSIWVSTEHSDIGGENAGMCLDATVTRKRAECTATDSSRFLEVSLQILEVSLKVRVVVSQAALQHAKSSKQYSSLISAILDLLKTKHVSSCGSRSSTCFFSDRQNFILGHACGRTFAPGKWSSHLLWSVLQKCEEADRHRAASVAWSGEEEASICAPA